MKTIIAILSLFVLLQCASKSEIVSNNTMPDPAFKVNFDNCIQIITLRQIDCKKVDCASDYWNAVYAFQCLKAVTGIESNIIVNSNDPYFYPTTENKDFTEFFYEDLIRWNDWYEQNKNSMTMAKADSLVKSKQSVIGYELKWPTPYTKIFSSNPPEPMKGPNEQADK